MRKKNLLHRVSKLIIINYFYIEFVFANAGFYFEFYRYIVLLNCAGGALL